MPAPCAPLLPQPGPGFKPVAVAEQHRLALEQLAPPPHCQPGVQQRAEQHRGEVAPHRLEPRRARQQRFHHQAGANDGQDRQLRTQFDPRRETVKTQSHPHHEQRAEIVLPLFVAASEARESQRQGAEQPGHGQQQNHQQGHASRSGERHRQCRRLLSPGNGRHNLPTCEPHAQEVEQRRHQAEAEHCGELAQHNLQPADWENQQGLHRAPFAFPRHQVDRRVKRPGQRHQHQHQGDEPGELVRRNFGRNREIDIGPNGGLGELLVEASVGEQARQHRPLPVLEHVRRAGPRRDRLIARLVVDNPHPGPLCPRLRHGRRDGRVGLWSLVSPLPGG